MLQYILKLSISLSVVYLFYQLLLRRLTFYTLNRWYLMAYSLLCFVIPFINVFNIVSKPAWRESAFIGYIPAIDELTKAQGQSTATSASFNWMQITLAVIIIGMAAMIVRLLIQYYSLFRMRSKAVLLHNDKVKLYHIDKPVIPFSFGKAIFVNQHQHNEEDLKDIIRHEFIHVKQRHSLDILWSELLCIVNWYNPFAWLLKKDIRQNLEFIADHQLLQTGLDRKQYQYLLLKVVGVNAYSIAPNFNFSSLKKRIAMMNKTKSAKVHLIRFLFILPLLVVVLLAFRNTRQQQQLVLRTVVTDTVPATKKLSSQDIESMSVNKTITVTLKNGQVEKYDMSDPKDQQAFKNKYGDLQEPPKPPTPPAVPPASAAEPVEPPAPPVPAVTSLKLSADSKPATAVSLKRDVAVSAEPLAIVKAEPAAKVSKHDVTIVRDQVAIVPDNVTTVNVAPTKVIVPDEFQGAFNDPKHLPSEIIGIISKTDTEDQLKQLQKDVENRGFKLQIDNTTYVNGLLANVIAKISNAGDDHSFSATDFDKILLIESMDKSGKFAGFHIVIRNGNKTTAVR